MEKLLYKLNECKLEVEEIEFDDDTSLDALLDRTKMYMSKLRPNDATIQQVNCGMFKANLIRDMWGSNEGAFQVAWQEGKVRLKNLIDKFIEEYELDKELKIDNSPPEEKKPQSSTYHIQNLNANGGIITIGSVINSTQNINNSIAQIETKIEEKGESDKEELYSILDEAKGIIDEISQTRVIKSKEGFYEKLSGHMSKHGWFYGEIIGLLGTALLGTLK